MFASLASCVNTVNAYANLIKLKRKVNVKCVLELHSQIKIKLNACVPKIISLIEVLMIVELVTLLKKFSTLIVKVAHALIALN